MATGRSPEGGSREAFHGRAEGGNELRGNLSMAGFFLEAEGGGAGGGGSLSIASSLHSGGGDHGGGGGGYVSAAEQAARRLHPKSVLAFANYFAETVVGQAFELDVRAEPAARKKKMKTALAAARLFG